MGTPKNYSHITVHNIDDGYKYHVSLTQRALIDDMSTTLLENSGNWQSTYTTVRDQSGSWIGGGGIRGHYIPLGGSSQITGDLIPLSASTYNLGSSANPWKDIYATSASLHLGDLIITKSFLEGLSDDIVNLSGYMNSGDTIDISYYPTNYIAHTTDISGNLDGINTTIGDKLYTSAFLASQYLQDIEITGKLDTSAKAISSDVTTGTNDTKFVTPKALTDSANIASGFVRLDGTSRLPAVDGSLLSNLPVSPIPEPTPISGAAPTYTISELDNGKVLTNANCTDDMAIQFPALSALGNDFQIGVMNEVGVHTGLAEGGTVTTYGKYYIHTFTSNGTFISPNAKNIDVFIVAGGGCGGNGGNAGGGGGGGGVILSTGVSIAAHQSYTVVVGSGGQVPDYQGMGANGENSSFNGLIAIGGGGGGCPGGGATGIGRNGGSGGGGGAIDAVSGGKAGGIGVVGQGHDGYTGTLNPWGIGGGGGGAGSAATSKNGGDGISINWSGASVYYAGGGGGGVDERTGTSAGSRGLGTGTNKGGGGQGANRTGTGAAGDAGVVIIRYAIGISSRVILRPADDTVAANQLPTTTALGNKLVSEKDGDTIYIRTTNNRFIGTSVFPSIDNWADTP